MKQLLLISTVITVAACADSTAPLVTEASLHAPTSAAKAVDQNQTIPSALVVNNDCNGDVVALTGETHILVHSTVSGSGSAHYFMDMSSKYDGVGVPSGVKYSGSTNRFLDDFFTGNPLPFSETVHIEFRLISQGNVANSIVSYESKIQFNANGVPTASFTNSSARCTG